MEDSGSGGSATTGQPRSRVDRASEEAALDFLRRNEKAKALKVLMTAYGTPLTAFALRILRDPELAKDVCQQVFLEAFQGIDTFEGRSTLWSWLCGIAYHRCLDELERRRRTPAVDDFDVLVELAGQTDSVMDENRVARQRAIERCLGKLPKSMRAQVLMRFYLRLTYAEIAEAVGDAPGTVQVRISRILPRLRRCLRNAGASR